MRAILTGLGVLVFLTACDTDKAVIQKLSPADAPFSIAASGVSLSPLWLARGFTSPEGVARYKDDIFISNISADGAETGGKGWITRLSSDGRVLNDKWVEGLNAPKGMAVHAGTMIVADVDRIHLIQADSGKRIDTHQIEGAEHLNDVTVWKNDIFISDAKGAMIYRMSANGPEPWIEDARLSGVNGLVNNGDRLLIITQETGTLYEANNTGRLTQIATGMENADGIGVVEGGYLVSSWTGKIWFVSHEGEVSELLSTTDAESLRDDLSLIEGSLVTVPNWHPGTVSAWTIA